MSAIQPRTISDIVVDYDKISSQIALEIRGIVIDNLKERMTTPPTHQNLSLSNTRLISVIEFETTKTATSKELTYSIKTPEITYPLQAQKTFEIPSKTAAESDESRFSVKDYFNPPKGSPIELSEWRIREALNQLCPGEGGKRWQYNVTKSTSNDEQTAKKVKSLTVEVWPAPKQEGSLYNTALALTVIAATVAANIWARKALGF